MSRRARLATLSAGVALMLAAAHTAAWWLVTDRLLAGFTAWQLEGAKDGLLIAAGAVRRGGWPFAAELVLADATLGTGVPGEPHAMAWGAGHVRLQIVPWHPHALSVLVGRDQTLRVGMAPPANMSWDWLDVRIPLGSPEPDAGASVEARGGAISLPGGPIRIERLSMQLREAGLFLLASAVTVPGHQLPFGGMIQSLDLHARTTGPLPAGSDPTALAAWRDNGQRLLIDDLAIRSGPLDVSGHASLGLDAALQPEGTAGLQVTGFVEATDALARSGALSRNDARVAATLLGLLARPGAGNGPEAELLLTLSGRTLSVGAFPVLRLPLLAVP